MKALAVVFAVLLAAACSGDHSTPVDAAKILRDGAASMAQLNTASATVKLTRGTISVQGFTLVSAKTAVRLPSESDTTYTVKQQDISFQLEVVTTADHAYLRLPLSAFQELTATQAAAFPNMARLFDPATGLPAMIPAGATPRYVSTDQLNGSGAYQVSTTYTPDQVHSLLSTLSSSGPVAAKVWVGVSDHAIRKAVLSGAFGDGGTAAGVEVDVTGLNVAVVITSPSP